MTIILVILSFLVLALLDYVLAQRKRVQSAAPEAERMPGCALQAPSIGGFLVPENLRYHAGHSWVLKERPRLFRVGMD